MSVLARLQAIGNNLNNLPGSLVYAGTNGSVTGDLAVSGTVSAQKFIGDGSLLSGVAAAGGSGFSGSDLSVSGLFQNNVTGNLLMRVFDESVAYGQVAQVTGTALLPPFYSKTTNVMQVSNVFFSNAVFASNVFAVKMEGLIKPAQSNVYQFRTTYNDGVKLWIGGVNVADSWTFQSSPQVITSNLSIVANLWTPFVLEHASVGNSQRISVEYSTNGSTWLPLTHGNTFQLSYDLYGIGPSQMGTTYFNGKTFFRDYAVLPNSVFSGRASELLGDSMTLGNLAVTGQAFLGNIAYESIVANTITANGAALTSLNATALTTGTLNNSRLPSAISVTSVAGSGSALTALNATAVTTGTLNNARLPSAISVTSVAGDGSALTALNATNIASGTLTNARLPSAISVTSVAGDGSALTALNATNIASGTLNNSFLPSAISVTSVAGDGSALTALNATNVTSGTLSNARLPSAISVTSVAGSGSGLTALNATNVTSGTLANARLPSAISVSSLTATSGSITGDLAVGGQVSRQVATVSYYNSNAQSIPYLSDTNILVNTAFASQGTTGLTLSSGVITNASGGKLTLLVTYNLHYSTVNTAGNRLAWIAYNNTVARYAAVSVTAQTNDGGGSTGLVASCVIILNANDTIVLRTFQTSGVTLSLGYSTSAGFTGNPTSYQPMTYIQLTIL